MTRQMLGDAEWAALKDKLQAIGRIWKHGDEGVTAASWLGSATC